MWDLRLNWREQTRSHAEPPPSPAQMVQLENWADSLQKTVPLEERKQFCGGSFLDFQSSRQCIIPSSKLYISVLRAGTQPLTASDLEIRKTLGPCIWSSCWGQEGTLGPSWGEAGADGTPTPGPVLSSEAGSA